MLDGLERADRAAELLADLGVVHRGGERVVGDARGLGGGQGDEQLVDVCGGDALEDAVGRDRHALQADVADRRRDVVRGRRGDGEPRRARLEKRPAGGAVHLDGQQQPSAGGAAVGDAGITGDLPRPVQGRGADAQAHPDGQAALGDRLTQRVGDGSACARDQDTGQRGGQDRAGRHFRRGLLEHARQVDDLGAGATVLLRDGDAEQPQLGESGPHGLPGFRILLLNAYRGHGIGGLRPGLDRVLDLGLIRGGGDTHCWAPRARRDFRTRRGPADPRAPRHNRTCSRYRVLECTRRVPDAHPGPAPARRDAPPTRSDQRRRFRLHDQELSRDPYRRRAGPRRPERRAHHVVATRAPSADPGRDPRPGRQGRLRGRADACRRREGRGRGGHPLPVLPVQGAPAGLGARP